MRQFLKHHLPKNIGSKLLMIERLAKLLVRPKVLRDLSTYKSSEKKTGKKARFSTNTRDMFPITGENTKYTSFDRHYVYHTSWAARVVSELASDARKADIDNWRHTDISSSLYFGGIGSAFVPVDF